MKITVVGIGYVGLSNAILLAQHNAVIALDVSQQKVNLINNKKSPIVDKEVDYFLENKKLNLMATTDEVKAYSQADYVIISTPTDYDPNLNSFNTDTVESVIERILSINPNAVMIIKSTVPVGYTAKVRTLFKTDNIIFSPEFYVKERLYMIIYIHHVLLLESNQNVHKNLRNYYYKERLKRIFQFYLPIQRKQRQ